MSSTTNKSHTKGSTLKSALLERLGTGLEFDRPLAPLTVFKTGGPAAYFIEVDSAAKIATAVQTAAELEIPFFILGGGSNVLVSDEGYDGLVIHVDCRGIQIQGDIEIVCGSGEPLSALVDFATDNGLTGLEFAAGIYGSVGGAMYGNAGAYGGEVGAVVKGLSVVTREGIQKEADAAYCKFGYRDSYLKVSGDVVVDVTFRLQPGDALAVKERVDEILKIRAAKFPPEINTAGCFFKNIPDASEEHGKLPAGRLLEAIGAKNMSSGGARVLANHANIIVNSGNATSKDIRKLADILRKKVLDEFQIELEEEIIQVGDF